MTYESESFVEISVRAPCDIVWNIWQAVIINWNSLSSCKIWSAIHLHGEQSAYKSSSRYI